MYSKTVLVVEDQPGQRLGLHEALETRGFQVWSAGNVAEARKIIAERSQEIDVAVLDMRLEDPQEPYTTGADIGLEILLKRENQPPEFLIKSAYSMVDYYKQALKLGAAAYLSKAETRQEDVIRYIRALTLRRDLSTGNPNTVREIKRITQTSRNSSEAIIKFCQEILTPHFSTSLGAPFFIIFTDENGSQNCAGTSDFPKGPAEIYELLQALGNGVMERSEPLILDNNQLPSAKNREGVKLYRQLHNAALLPIAQISNHYLSICIIQTDVEVDPPSEDAGALARVLAEYLRPAMIETLLNILVDLQRSKVETILSITSDLCYHVGQEQLASLEEAVAASEIKRDSKSYRQLETLADDLMVTGRVLMTLGNPDPAPEALVRMAPIVRDAWEDLCALMQVEGVELRVEGDCVVQAVREDMRIAVMRVLQWMMQRQAAIHSEMQSAITVKCKELDNTPQVIFEDSSQRISEQLRHNLFSPFTLAVTPLTTERAKGPGLYLPLYFAKMLVEEKYGGWLEDKTHELPGEVGHQLVMRFPRPLLVPGMRYPAPAHDNSLG